MRLIAVKCSATGHLVGESNRNAKHSDRMVDEVRAMHFAQGLRPFEIIAKTGINRRTVRDWLAGKRRTQKWVKIRMRRVYE